MAARRRPTLVLTLLIAASILAGRGDRAIRCMPFHKGFPLCGL